MRRSATIRYLIGAWLAVGAVVGLAWFLKPDSEPLFSQVDAAYESMPERAPYVTFDETTDPEVRADPAEVSSETQAELDAWERIGYQVPEGTSRLYGTVRGQESGDPVALVRVELRGQSWWHRWSAETNPAGEYEIANLPGGLYELRAGGGRSDALERTIRHSLPIGDDDEQRVDFEIEQGGRVWGTVTDLAGKPIQNARVLLGTSDSVVTQVAQAAKKRRFLGANTNELGKYVVRGVPFEQEWRLWVDEDELAPVLTPSFVLHPTRPQVRMDVTLLAGSTIYGRVETPLGKAIEDAEVTCIPRYSSLLAPMVRAKTARNTRSKEDGSFVLTGLPAGDYQILGFKDEYRIAFKGKPVYPDGRTDIAGVRVVLEPAMGEGSHVIYGRVIDTDGKPVEAAHIGLAAIGMDTLSFGGTETQTAADGTFRFEGLGEGSFLLAAQKQGYQQHITEKVAVDTEIVVTLEPEASIRGRVKFPPGKKPSSVFTVRVVRSVPEGEEGPQSFIQTMESMGSAKSFDDPGGAFALQGVQPGKVLLEAKAPGFAPGRVEVSLGDGQSKEGVVIRLPAEGAKIRGRVIDFSGAPVHGATVRAVEVGSGASGLLSMLDRRRDNPEARTDKDGAYLLSGLASTVYRVTIEHRDYAPATLPAVQTQGGQPPVEANAVLRGGGIIEGVSKPGVMVTVAGEGYSSLAATKEDGTFKIVKVPAGEYLARAVMTSEDDFTQAPEIYRLKVTVREGQTVRLDFLEEPEGRTLTGKLQPKPGQGDVGMVLLRLPGSPAPNPNDLIWQGELGVNDAETSRYVVAEGLLEPDGRYTLKNIPPGRYVLDIYVNSVMGTLAGNQARLEKREEITVD